MKSDLIYPLSSLSFSLFNPPDLHTHLLTYVPVEEYNDEIDFTENEEDGNKLSQYEKKKKKNEC